MLTIETRGASDVPKRTHQSIGQIFRFAIAREFASQNHAADFKPRDILAAAESEDFARVDEKDLPELLAKMDDYNGDALTRFGLKLLAYCFPRTNELIEAPWTEFDLDRARWDMDTAQADIVALGILGRRISPRGWVPRAAAALRPL